MENIKVENKEKKSFKSWVKKHKTGIFRTVTVLGGLCLLESTRKEAYRKGLKDNATIDVTDDGEVYMVKE